MITEQDLEKIKEAQNLASRSKFTNEIIVKKLGQVISSAKSLQQERPNPAPQIVASPGPMMEEVLAMRNGVEASRHV